MSRKGWVDRYKNAITPLLSISITMDTSLFVGSYFQPINVFRPETPRFFPESFETPTTAAGIVYHNNHDGTFTDVTEKPLQTQRWTLDLGHADANNDGWTILHRLRLRTDHFFVNNGAVRSATKRNRPSASTQRRA